jgi:hypothetical protein
MAKALPLPTKFGQSLIIEKGSNKEIHCRLFDHDGSVWFENISFFNNNKSHSDRRESVPLP